MNTAIVALGAVPWNEVIKAAPKLVESARRFYESARAKEKKDSETTSDALTLAQVNEGVEDLNGALEEFRQDATAQAELSTQLAAQVEALSRGLEEVSSRQRWQKFQLIGVAALSAIAVLLAFVI